MGRPIYLRNEGQATLEYLVVGIVLLAVIAGVGSIWHFASSGKLSSFVTSCVSHGVSSAEGVADVLLY